MSTLISQATAKDILPLVELMARFYAQSDIVLDEHWTVESFAAFIENPNKTAGSIWLIRSGGHACGYAVLALYSSVAHGGIAGHVEDLFIEHGYRRCGPDAALAAWQWIPCSHRVSDTACDISAWTSQTTMSRRSRCTDDTACGR